MHTEGALPMLSSDRRVIVSYADSKRCDISGFEKALIAPGTRVVSKINRFAIDSTVGMLLSSNKLPYNSCRSRVIRVHGPAVL